ncbi:MAG: glycosyltransferase family 4 protein [Sphingobacteriia bacterium]|nr:glycosyltransferase family 4 protein [Sphingobacteriia bacterium]
MNVLIINHYAGSLQYGMSYRPYYLAREWVKMGHNVAIIGASYSHLRNKQPDSGHEEIDQIQFLWLKTIRYKGNGLGRIISIIQFVIKLILSSGKISKKFKPDVVIASSTYPLDIYPAYLISKRNKAKLVFELHDMWPLSPMLIGNYKPYHPFIWLIQRAENFACKNSDCYISLLGNAKDYLIKHGLTGSKFHYVPNGYSFENVDSKHEKLPLEHKELLSILKSKHKLIIGYTGGIAPSNAMKNLVLTAEYIQDLEAIAFVIVGNGIQKEELTNLCKIKKLTNVYFLPFIPKSSIPALLEQFDILYAGGTKSILHSYGTSYNKIVDYLLAEKPILFAVDEPNSIVERIGCGWQIEAEDPKKLETAIRQISLLSLEQREMMGRKGREYAIKELNYHTLASKIIAAIEEIK